MAEAQSIITECMTLKNDWQPRNDKMKEWYKILQLYNDLQQEKMESVISSDPRTGFNMARHLIYPRTYRFVVDTSQMTELQSRAVSRIENYCDLQFQLSNEKGDGTLWGPFITKLQGLMLATGWYSIISFPTADGWVLQAWNPASIYPEYDNDGNLIKVARMYRMDARHASRKCAEEGWANPELQRTGPVNCYQLWSQQSGYVRHQVVIGLMTVKDMFHTEFGQELPILCGPVAGLPDDGSIMQDTNWKKDIGQSVIAPVADVAKNYDRMLTYMQQIVRDTANPRWVEEVRKHVLDPERLFERGAVFSIEPGERIYPLPGSPIPPEARTHLFDLHSQMQRGLFSDVAFGNIQGQVSVFMMSSVVAASKQILQPFHDATMKLLGKVATRNINLMRQHGLKLDNESFPAVPQNLRISYNYDVEIPGDFLQRASAAKTINPDFKLSRATLISILFPEVKSSIVEIGRVMAEDAALSPEMSTVFKINQMYRAAEQAMKEGDDEYARMLQAVAFQMEQMTTGQQSQPCLNPPANVLSTMPSFSELLRR